MGTGSSTTLLAFVIAAPILLVHGYGEGASVWNSWKSWLAADGFKDVYNATFKDDDQCGNVGDHAMELSGMINRILHDTSSKQLNIIAHSKGGLDARWYISHTPTDKVANLIMLATPNAGTYSAYLDLTECAYTGSDSTGLEDLQPGSEATQTPDRTNDTKYFNIAGNVSMPCAFVVVRSMCYFVESDGFVTSSSALSHGKSLGIFPYNHTGLLNHLDVYERVLGVLS